MKDRPFISFIIIIALAISIKGSAQLPLDTVKLDNRTFEFQGEEYKNLPNLREAMLQTPLDPQVESYWNRYNTTHNVAMGMEIGGIGLMGYGLVRSLQGKESSAYTIAGASLALTGIVFDLLVAKPQAMSALGTHNDLVIGRDIADFDALTYGPVSEADIEADDRSIAPARNRNSKPSGDTFIGLTFGTGWSRQKINYDYIFDKKFQSAKASYFGIQIGRSKGGKIGWQIGFGLTQHGKRLEESSLINGVQTFVKVDERIRFLEIPIGLNYKLPLGDNSIELIPVAGLNLGYALSGLYVSNGSGHTETREVDVKVIDKVSMTGVKFGNRLDLALNIGVQVPYSLGPGEMIFEARYHYGILNLDRNSDFQITENGDKVFNRSVFIGLGYRYQL